MKENLIGELREIRSGLREVDGVLATPKAIEVMGRTETSASQLANRYSNDCAEVGRAELIGYRLSPGEPASETFVHVAFDPEPGRIVIYEEW